MRNLPKSILLINILLVIFLIIGGVYLHFRSRSSQVANRQDSVQETVPTIMPAVGSHGIITSEINGKQVKQIKGLVLDKEESPRVLVIRQPGGEKRVVVEDNPSISKVEKIDGRETVAKGKWEEIEPQKTVVIGVCLNQDCSLVKNILVIRVE